MRSVDRCYRSIAPIVATTLAICAWGGCNRSDPQPLAQPPAAEQEVFEEFADQSAVTFNQPDESVRDSTTAGPWQALGNTSLQGESTVRTPRAVRSVYVPQRAEVPTTEVADAEPIVTPEYTIPTSITPVQDAVPVVAYPAYVTTPAVYEPSPSYHVPTQSSPVRETAPQRSLPDRLMSATALVQQATTEQQQAAALATRGSLFVARSKFIRALRLWSQGADAQSGTHDREDACNAALRALEEVEDFVRREGDDGRDLTLVIRSHRTNVIDEAEAKQIAAGDAVVRYMQFAQQRLIESAAGLPQAAVSLHGLGRLHDMLSGHASIVAAEDKARVFYESALAVDPSHAAASNDLGVLLAKHGRLHEARSLLNKSVAMRPNAAGYHNLAVVNQRLGDAGVASTWRQAAYGNSNVPAAWANPAMTPWQQVQWLETSAFAQTSQVVSDPAKPVAEPTPPGAPTGPPLQAARPSTVRNGARWQQ